MMFGKRPKSYGEEISEKVDCILKEIWNDKVAYDEETKLKLEEIENSDRDTNWYLKKILWELVYARRESERP